MNRLRKILVAAVLGMSMAAPFAGASFLDPPSVLQHQRHDQHRFAVYCRLDVHSPWIHVGTFGSETAAQEVARGIRELGVEAFVSTAR